MRKCDLSIDSKLVINTIHYDYKRIYYYSIEINDSNNSLKMKIIITGDIQN